MSKEGFDMSTEDALARLLAADPAPAQSPRLPGDAALRQRIIAEGAPPVPAGFPRQRRHVGALAGAFALVAAVMVASPMLDIGSDLPTPTLARLEQGSMPDTLSPAISPDVTGAELESGAGLPATANSSAEPSSDTSPAPAADAAAHTVPLSVPLAALFTVALLAVLTWGLYQRRH